jgi:hypothetical protein
MVGFTGDDTQYILRCFDLIDSSVLRGRFMKNNLFSFDILVLHLCEDTVFPFEIGPDPIHGLATLGGGTLCKHKICHY